MKHRTIPLINYVIYVVLLFMVLGVFSWADGLFPRSDDILFLLLIYGMIRHSSHEYRINTEEQCLVILSGPFKSLPILETRIPFTSITSVQEYAFKPWIKIFLIPWLAIPILGNIRISRWVMIERKPSRYYPGFPVPPLLWRPKLLIAPDNVESFIEQLGIAIRQSSTQT